VIADSINYAVAPWQEDLVAVAKKLAEKNIG